MSGQRSTFVKVCGLTQEQQIDWAVELGYDAAGIVVTPKSKRYCPPGRAVALAGHARGRIPVFAVALAYAETAAVAEHFDVIQIYETADVPNLALASATPPEKPDTAVPRLRCGASRGLVPAEPGGAYTGRFCCSMYCLTTLSGAPPTVPAK
ncbi:hypothetical protein [Streptomyces shenzhenensis]|uniref:hypothetical protein n=1 Tax=Streptomyces shenzhenensis TaxID=943815 RepID=UPI001F21DA57|nr:hypothetical protein [Streptomyces shenzhenensis]